MKRLCTHSISSFTVDGKRKTLSAYSSVLGYMPGRMPGSEIPGVGFGIVVQNYSDNTAVNWKKDGENDNEWIYSPVASPFYAGWKLHIRKD